MTSFPPLLLWLLGTLLPLGALWLLFRGLLRRERCYRYNRLLLLLAPVLAAGLPLLPRPELPAWLLGTGAGGSALPTVLLPAAIGGPAAAAGPAGWPWQNGLLVLYGLGVAVGLARLAWQLGQLWDAAHDLPRVPQAGYTLVRTGGQLPTSSFGRTVFWDETAALAPAEVRAVLAHELAHVRQGHTFDVLWLAVWRAVLWPNPFAHLLLPALRLTHELLADQAATQAEAVPTGAAAYPAILARLAVQRLAGPGYLALLQPFTVSFILTRIAMLQNQIPVRRWKQWLLLPVLGGLFFAACRTADVRPMPTGRAWVMPVPSDAEQKATADLYKRKMREAMYADSVRRGGKEEPGMVQWLSVTRKDAQSEPVVTITWVKKDALPPAPPTYTREGAKIYSFVEQMPQLPGGGGQAGIVAAIQQNLAYPKSPDGKPLPEGRAFASFVVDADGAVQDAKIVKGLGPAFDEALLAAINKLPRFEPGKQGGQPVAVSFTVPVLFKLQP